MVPTESLSAPRNRKINNGLLATSQDASVTAAGMYCLIRCVERRGKASKLPSFEDQNFETTRGARSRILAIFCSNNIELLSSKHHTHPSTNNSPIAVLSGLFDSLVPSTLSAGSYRLGCEVSTRSTPPPSSQPYAWPSDSEDDSQLRPC